MTVSAIVTVLSSREFDKSTYFSMSSRELYPSAIFCWFWKCGGSRYDSLRPEAMPGAEVSRPPLVKVLHLLCTAASQQRRLQVLLQAVGRALLHIPNAFFW